MVESRTSLQPYGTEIRPHLCWKISYLALLSIQWVSIVIKKLGDISQGTLSQNSLVSCSCIICKANIHNKHNTKPQERLRLNSGIVMPCCFFLRIFPLKSIPNVRL